MGFVGDFLSSNAADIGGWIDKAFGGSGATGRKIGGAASGLLKLIPLERGGMVHYIDPRTGKVVRSVQKKKAPAKKAPAKKGKGKNKK
jgi:hypothetical protein